MTWAQLKTAVEAQLTTLKLPLTVQVAAIEWNAEEFGGPMPTVRGRDNAERCPVREDQR